MFERILLPLDGSELAEKALPYGEELGKRLGSEIILLHVCGPEHLPHQHMHKVYLDNMAENLARKIREGAPHVKAKVTARVEVGDPHDNICSLVEKNDIGLIIMTASGDAGVKPAILGSVADHVCRTVPTPVILIKPQDASRIQGKQQLISRIFLPSDGSDLSKLAFPVAEELATRLKVPITLFEMAQMFIPYVADESSTYFDTTKLDEETEGMVNGEVIALEKELTAKGLSVTHEVTLGRDAAGDIIELSKKTGADLIIMSTHGRSGMGRWVLGSVVEKVLRHGELPLLLVHTRAG